jgi:hypothetical protein
MYKEMFPFPPSSPSREERCELPHWGEAPAANGSYAFGTQTKKNMPSIKFTNRKCRLNFNAVMIALFAAYNGNKNSVSILIYNNGNVYDFGPLQSARQLYKIEH